MTQWDAYNASGIRVCSVYEVNGRWVNGRKTSSAWDAPLLTFATRAEAMREFAYRQPPQPFRWDEVEVPQVTEAHALREKAS